VLSEAREELEIIYLKSKSKRIQHGYLNTLTSEFILSVAKLPRGQGFGESNNLKTIAKLEKYKMELN
jgi:hypothetical protein